MHNDHTYPPAIGGHGDTPFPTPTSIPGLAGWPPVIGYDGLGVLLQRAVSTLQADRIRRPWTIPPACTPPGSRQPRWITVDVIDWLRSHREQPVQPPVCVTTPTNLAARHRGAPSKSERIEAARRGITVPELRRATRGKGGEA